MAIFKCKMCGGDLEVKEGMKVVECEYCGTSQTVPEADSEKKMNLFNRANRLRLSNEFDKAAGVFESIVAEFPKEAEAYWGLCLCKYGIEYVDDAATAKKIPTCHRTSYESIFDDGNYKLTLEYADSVAADTYRAEAKEIDSLQRSILEIASREEPFDVFICYKETGEDGQRTKDSVLAQDIYDALVAKGYKVFFARITLEDKLGQEYEPYIFSALNSAKVMLAIGTTYDHYNAVWVKNEWSRFLDLMKKDKKKVLIPCYADMDAYDMPPEFKNLQGQDMGKVGFLQDIIRGIGKIIPLSKTVTSQQIQQVIVPNSNIENLLKRGNMALADKKWDDAEKFFERVLDEDAENAQAYLGKMMALYQFSDERKLVCYDRDISMNDNFVKAYKFADDDLKKKLEEYDNQCKENSDRRMAWIERNTKSTIVAGGDVTIQLKSDGTVQAMGDWENDYCDVTNWHDIVSVALVRVYACDVAVGLRMDGRLEIGGNYPKVTQPNTFERAVANALKWREIKSVVAGGFYIVGLKNNGTVIVSEELNTEGESNVFSWKNIIAIAAGETHIVGLKVDGTVVAVGNNKYGQCNVCSWNNIVAVAARMNYTVGLKSDGTVLVTGRQKKDMKFDTSSWQNIIKVAAGWFHLVGLKSDGTVVATGDNHLGQNNTYEWKDIVEIAAGDSYTVGLKSNGSIVAVGANDSAQCESLETSALFREAKKLYNSVYVEDIQKALELFSKLTNWDYSKEWIARCERILPDRIKITQRIKDNRNHTIAAGRDFVVGMDKNGRIVYILGGFSGSIPRASCTAGWQNLCALSSYSTEDEDRMVALRTDGTVLREGTVDEPVKTYRVKGLEDVVSIAVGGDIFGLKKDGTVVAAEGHYMSDWKDIAAISASKYHVVGLKWDGTVLAKGKNSYGQCNVSEWNNIVAIAAGINHTVGLMLDGSVVAVGDNSNGACNVSKWKNIKAIAAGRHTVGLHWDGKLEMVGANEVGQCNIEPFLGKNIRAIAASWNYTVGIGEGNTIVVGDGCGKYGKTKFSEKLAEDSQEINQCKEYGNPTLNIRESSSGCYIATCVYGSYDCPQVWTLRRFRDNTLASTWYGRCFVKLYYAISPSLVKWFGNTNIFKKICRKPLEYLVNKLHKKGVSDKPYNDKPW